MVWVTAQQSRYLALSLGCSLKKGCVALYKSCFLFRIVVNCCIEAGAYYSLKCSPESETILYQECTSPSRLYNSGTESNCLDESSFNPLLLSIPHVQHQASSACGLIIASYAALLLTWFEPGASAFFPTRSPAQVPAFTPDQDCHPICSLCASVLLDDFRDVRTRETNDQRHPAGTN